MYKDERRQRGKTPIFFQTKLIDEPFSEELSLIMLGKTSFRISESPTKYDKMASEKQTEVTGGRGRLG